MSDPAALAKDLHTRAAAMRADAKHAHEATARHFQATHSKLGIERDAAARKKFAAEKDAEAADVQVTRETREAEAAGRKLADSQRALAAAERRHDDAAAEDARENVRAFEGIRDAHVARARAATLDAADAREAAATQAKQVTQLELRLDDLAKASREATAEIDDLQIQARELEQAAKKYEAAASAADPAARDKLMAEASSQVSHAESMDIDRDKIRMVVPGFPEDPASVPAGTGEAAAVDPSDGEFEGQEEAIPRGGDPVGAPPATPHEDVVGDEEEAAGGEVQHQGEENSGREEPSQPPMEHEDMVGDEQAGTPPEGQAAGDADEEQEAGEDREAGESEDAADGAAIEEQMPADPIADPMDQSSMAPDPAAAALVPADDQGYVGPDDSDGWVG
jgi:hypothetical protein